VTSRFGRLIAGEVRVPDFGLKVVKRGLRLGQRLFGTLPSLTFDLKCGFGFGKPVRAIAY
jgi:hypothetical protein